MDLQSLKRPLRIGFSALLTEGGRSGIGQYIIQLLGSLQENDATNRYVVFALKGDPSLDYLKSERFTVVRVPGIFARPVPSILWHWFVLPILARRWRLELLHLPSTRRPCPLSPCPTVITVHDLAVLRISGKYGPFRHLYFRRRSSSAARRTTPTPSGRNRLDRTRRSERHGDRNASLDAITDRWLRQHDEKP